MTVTECPHLWVGPVVQDGEGVMQVCEAGIFRLSFMIKQTIADWWILWASCHGHIIYDEHFPTFAEARNQLEVVVRKACERAIRISNDAITPLGLV